MMAETAPPETVPSDAAGIAPAASGADASGIERHPAELDARLSERIRAELERQEAMPVALRGLVMMAEAFIEPSETPKGYEIVDRMGEPRFRTGSAGPGVPMTLTDLVAELRQQRPQLFGQPEPEPVPAKPPPPAAPAATPPADANQGEFSGRLLAGAARRRFDEWRARRAEREAVAENVSPAPSPTVSRQPSAPPRPVASAPPAKAAPIAAPPAAPPPPREVSSEPVQRVASTDAPAAARLDDDTPPPPLPVAVPDSPMERPIGGLLRSRGLLAGAGALAVVAAIGLGVVLTRRTGTVPTPPTGTQTAENGTPPKSETAPPAGEVRTNAPPGPVVTPPPTSGPPTDDADPEAAPADDGPPDEMDAKDPDGSAKNPNEIAGIPEVIDTATLRINGKVVHLFGVEWVRGAQANDLKSYLRGRAVSCQPAPGSSAHTCMVEGRDLSEVVLFNGGGRASSEASPDLVAAEEHAREERLGVWNK